MVFPSLVLCLAGLDIYVKEQIEKQDEKEFPRDMEGAGGKVKLYRNHNSGFSFGFLEERQELVRMIPLVFTSALGGIFGWLLTRKGETMEKLAVSLAFGGALSNLYDRLTRNYVVDYINIQVGWLKKVVFNLADLFILAGACLLAAAEVVRTLSER